MDNKTLSSTELQTERLARKLRFGHMLLLDALDRCGTLQEAALRLKLSRSAVSKSLGEIESAAGSSLFERSRRGLKANAVGQVYLRGARRMLNDLQLSVEEASMARDSDAALLRIGTPPFLGATLLPPVLERTLASVPHLQMRITQAPFPELVHAVHDSSLDCLLTALTAELVQAEIKPDLHIEHLYMEKTYVLAPRLPPWTRRRTWRMEELADARWVMLPWPLALRRALNNAFLQAGCIPPEPIIETTALFSHAALAAAANALVLFQGPMVPQALALAAGRLMVLKVDPVPVIGPIALVTRKGRLSSPALGAFAAAARAVARAQSREVVPRRKRSST